MRERSNLTLLLNQLHVKHAESVCSSIFILLFLFCIFGFLHLNYSSLFFIYIFKERFGKYSIN